MRASELFDVSGEVVLVTGGGGGIGLAMARVLALNGAKIALADIDLEGAQAAAASLRSGAAAAVSVELDVRDEQMIVAAFDRVEAELGRVSVLINNAGSAHRDKAISLPVQTWRSVMDVNVEGAFAVAQEAARRMIRDGNGGSIINVSSILSEIPIRQVAAYSTSKAAVSQMTRCLALEWAKHQIRVNEIRPGWFETALTGPFLKGAGAKVIAGQNPMGRLGDGSDLAGAVLLLASGAGKFMTGSSITIDGGHSIGR
ncbi:SDR family NAD(P)-dependent oxidoreductase [Hoeflea sp.]|uniref:SDR family NAD(P)-dependent oxidoreductase n=1 Tax=Hoeflea sp. TaxID=1940281 RepID=UPI0037493780